MKNWRLGILGMGEGRSLMAAALAEPGWELVNICDLNEDLCRERMREFGFDRFTAEYQEMLVDPSIDVIGIYTPDQMHREHILQTLRAGKHVICTKPLMVSLDGARELLEAQRLSGKTVFVGQSSRFYETAMRQRADYEAGKLGDLITLETQYISDSRWFLQKAWSHREGFSWLYNFLIHALDLAVWYLPGVETVYAAGVNSSNSQREGITAPDAIKVLLTDTEGRSATVNGVYASPNFRFDVDPMISCTLRGTAGISRGGSELMYYHKYEGTDKGTVSEDFSDRKPYYDRFGNGQHHVGEYQNYIRYFATCLEEGRTPLPDLKEGLRTLAVMQAVERSMSSGRAESVREILNEFVPELLD